MVLQKTISTKVMATTKTFPTAFLLVFFIFAIVGMLAEMPSAAAISCGTGETQTESRSVSHPMIYCYGCQDQCINQCKSQGRHVSQIECNFWGSEQAVCKCCCASPSSSTPTPKPIAWNECPAEETNKYFSLVNSAIECSLCVNACKTKCEDIGATMTREVCFQNFQVGTTVLIDKHLVCPCCCKPNPPPPPPCPCSGCCGVDINIQISSGQAPRKDQLPQSSSSNDEL